VKDVEDIEEDYKDGGASEPPVCGIYDSVDKNFILVSLHVLVY
jgi:hypothetical protein